MGRNRRKRGRSSSSGSSSSGSYERRNRRKRGRTNSLRKSSSSGARTPSPPPSWSKKKGITQRYQNVSNNYSTVLQNIIPDFDPLKDNINAWLNVIKSYAESLSWSDETIRYQALNKLNGSAKIWYDSLLRNNNKWPLWKWRDWESKLT